ncbi:MAG: hypothetical protein KGI97_04685 [Alphaproteobacteria bacterium]|nr:hypothetical protein [Alphaproteobacteria bacterium]
MFGTPAAKVSGPLIQAIEDAVLFGNVQEIDGILDMVEDDPGFPENLRRGLEALMYIRMYYGKGGALEPADPQERERYRQMESWWGREVIEMVGHYPDLSQVKYA